MIAPIDLNAVLTVALAAYIVRCIFLYSMRKLDVTGRPLCTRRPPQEASHEEEVALA